MALIKLQDRLRIYYSVLKRMEGEHERGICFYLRHMCYAHTSLNLTYDDFLKHFPEIEKHRPDREESDGYWWKRDPDGYSMRKYVLKEAIKEVGRKLYKYQKLHS
jgi:hypothetical protein